MRPGCLLLAWVLVLSGVLSCSGTLKKENAQLKEEIAALKRSADSRNEKVREAFLTELGAARQAASFDLKDEEISANEGECASDPAVQAYMRVRPVGSSCESCWGLRARYSTAACPRWSNS